MATDQSVGDDRVAGRHRQPEWRAFHRGLTELQPPLGFAGGDTGELGDEIDPVAASVLVSERPGAEVGFGTSTDVGVARTLYIRTEAPSTLRPKPSRAASIAMASLSSS
jgi:hypothetical protein